MENIIHWGSGSTLEELSQKGCVISIFGNSSKPWATWSNFEVSSALSNTLNSWGPSQPRFISITYLNETYMSIWFSILDHNQMLLWLNILGGICNKLRSFTECSQECIWLISVVSVVAGKIPRETWPYNFLFCRYTPLAVTVVSAHGRFNVCNSWHWSKHLARREDLHRRALESSRKHSFRNKLLHSNCYLVKLFCRSMKQFPFLYFFSNSICCHIAFDTTWYKQGKCWGVKWQWKLKMQKDKVVQMMKYSYVFTA